MILDCTLDFIFTNNKNLTVDLSNQILIPTYRYNPVLELVLGINFHNGHDCFQIFLISVIQINIKIMLIGQLYL